MTSAEHQPTGEELMAYLDGEMPQEAAADIQSHLASCVVCQRIVSDLKAASAELERWHVEDPPPSLQLPAAPRAQTRAPWLAMLRFRPAMAWSLAGGVAVVGLVIVSTFTRPSPRPAVFAEATAEPRATEATRAPERAFRQGRGGGGGGAKQQPLAGGQVEPAPATPAAQPSQGPMIARWARLTIVASRFDEVRPAIDRILREVNGFAGRIDATTARGASRTVNATLRVPASSLDAALGSLKRLGQVVSESQGGDDVTEQVVDVAARLKNARQTEGRLTQLLRERTGKVSDVLEAEREISRVREEIERLDAERTNLDRRVTYATVAVEVTEEPKAAMDMGPLPVPTRLRNAFVDGIRSALESLLGLSLTLLNVGPTLAVWIALLFFPVRSIVRRTWPARG
jgi:anti-sigma factor RsiW